MAAPAWAVDFTDIYVGGAGTFSALGGGASGLNTESDYFIQGTDCKSKNAWTNAIKGLIHDHGTSFTVPSTGCILAWLYYAAVNALEVQEPGGSPSNGGLMLVEGSGSGNYNRYNVAGSDTLTFDSWVPYVVDPNTATADDTVGTPSGTEQWVGVEANLPTTAGPTKGAPIAIDAVRYGRGQVDYTAGDGTSGYNTFAGAEGYGNAVTRRWGLIEYRQGSYFIQGYHALGTSGTAVDFRDSDKVIFIHDTPYVAAGFNRIEVVNSGSNVDWDNIIIQALGTQSPGTLVVTAGAFDAISCQFISMGALTFLSTSVLTDCVISGCGQVTAPGTDMGGTIVQGYEGTAGTAAVVWNVATDPTSLLDDMTFAKGTAATHAIEFGSSTPASVTVNGWTTSGYNASNGQNDSTFYNNTGGALTINVVGGTGNFSYRNGSGASTTLVVDPVTLTVTVKAAADFALIENARVLVTPADELGPFLFNDTVTSITQTGGTATVTHQGHGMETGDTVLIKGCDQAEYNITGVITVTGANSYTYAVDSGATSPATTADEILATFVLIDGLTNASGVISDTRAYSSNQNITGRVRKASASPYYKTGAVTGEVSSTSGLGVTVLLIDDE